MDMMDGLSVMVCDECGKEGAVGCEREWLEVRLLEGVDYGWKERWSAGVVGTFCGVGCLMERVGRVGMLMRVHYGQQRTV